MKEEDYFEWWYNLFPYGWGWDILINSNIDDYTGNYFGDEF